MLICILKIFLRLYENVISQVIIGISSMGKYNKTPYSVSFQLKGGFLSNIEGFNEFEFDKRS